MGVLVRGFLSRPETVRDLVVRDLVVRDLVMISALEITEEIGAKKTAGRRKSCSDSLASAGLGSLLALSLILAPKALWAAHGTLDNHTLQNLAKQNSVEQSSVEQNSAKKNLIMRNCAKIATKVAKGSWHTVQIAGAGLLAQNVMNGWRVTERMRTASMSFWAGALFVSGVQGLKELCSPKKASDTHDALQAVDGRARVQKVVRGMWYTAQLGYWGCLVYYYRKVRNPNLSSRLLMGCMTGTCLSNTFFGFKDLFFKKKLSRHEDQ
jgi:hypothetical protein